MAKKVCRRILAILAGLIIGVSCLVFAAQIKFRLNYEISLCAQYSMLPSLNKNEFLNDYEYITGVQAAGLRQPGDWVILNKKNKTFKLGDIVSANINWPATGNEAIIKRLVGLPGNTLRIEKIDDAGVEKYNLYNNDKLLYTKPRFEFIGKSTATGEDKFIDNSSTYYSYLEFLKDIKNQQNGNVGFDEEKNPYNIILKDNEYFLLGDNWQVSYDCMDRNCGPINISNLGSSVVATIGSNQNYKWEVFKYTFKLLFK